MLINDKYEVIKNLGKGAQGEVFLVKRNFGKADLFALKTIRIKSANKQNLDEITGLFISEFKLISSLKHPNIIEVNDFGYIEDNESYYFTMEFVDGCNFFDFLANREVSNETLLKIIYQILSGLNYLHANNVIHYDIKPENILIQNPDTDPQAKLLDFGLAGLATVDKRKIRGTLSYMAPELFIPNNLITNKIDLYSLGVSILLAFCKQPATSTYFNSSGFLNKTKNILGANLALLKNLADGKLRKFLELLIEPDPSLRINSAYEAIAALNDLFGQQFVLPSVWSLDSCEHNSRFLAREELFQEIHHVSQEKNILIYGHSGCGLSRVLQRLHYQLSLNLVKVIYFDKSDMDNNPLEKLLNEIQSIYNSLLKKGIIGQDERTASNESLNNSEIQIVINQISKYRPLYILIDDYQLFDSSFTEQINSLIQLNNPNCHVSISYKLEQNSEERNVKLELLRRGELFNFYELADLNKSQIKEVVSALFGAVVNLPPDFHNDLVKASGGNFRQLMLILDLLIQNKIIAGYKNLFIYSDPENRCKNILKANIAINSKLPAFMNSVFQILLFAPLGLSREVLIKYSGTNAFNLQKQLDQLCNKTILRYRNINKVRFYFLSERRDFVKLIKNSAKKLKTIIEISIRETAKIIDSRSADEQYYLTILKCFLKSETEIFNLCDQLKSNAESRLRFFYFNLAVELVENPALKVSLLLESGKQFFTNSEKDRAINCLKRMELLIKKSKLDECRWQLVYLKIYLHDDEKYFVKPQYFLKNYELMKDKLPTKVFLDLMVKMSESFLQGRYSIYSKKIISITYQMLEKLPSEFRFYRYLLECYEYFYNLVSWNDTHLDTIENYLDDFVESKTFTNDYFKTLYSYISYFTLFKNRSSNTRFLKYLKNGMSHAKTVQNNDFLMILSNHLGLYYRNSGQYDSAIKIYENILSQESKVRNFNRSNIFNNLSLIKYDTLLPVNEVLYLFLEACREQRKYTSLSSYSVQLSNISVVNCDAGNFAESGKYLDESLKYFDFIGSIYQEPILNRIPAYSAYFVDKAEALSKIKSVYHGDLEKIEQRIEQCYDYILNNNIEAFYPAEWLLPDGIFRDESLEITLFLTLKNRQLPDIKSIMETVAESFKADNHPESNLIYLLVRFIYAPSDERANNLLRLFHKIQLNGYHWIVVQHLAHFLVFLLILKMDFKEMPSFFKLLKENFSFLKEHCTPTQLEQFKQTYLAKTVKKLLKKY